MNCKLPRKIGMQAASVPISVSVTGAGSSTVCYAQYGGTKYYTSGNTFTAMSGSVITFGIKGASTTNYGFIKINGLEVLYITDGSTQTIDWTLPNNISSVTVQMETNSKSQYGRITVTTA